MSYRVDDEHMRLALQAAAVGQSRSSLTLSQARQLNQVIKSLRSDDNERAMKEKWNSFIENQANAGGTMDPNGFVQDVLREAYLSSTRTCASMPKRCATSTRRRSRSATP